jgi:hypothetical protein
MLPIISTQNPERQADLAGTGFLFDDDGRLFLITAAHLYEPGVDLTQFAVPRNPEGPEIWTLGSFVRHTPRNDDSLDVMALEINSPEVEQWLRRGWSVITREHVALPEPNGHFIVSGFPRALSRSTEERLYGKPISIHTGMLAHTPANADQPVLPDIDLFLLCDDSSELLDGRPSTIPMLKGISGAPLWEYREPKPGEIWSAETAVKVVGISTACRVGEYVRGKSWRLISKVLASRNL